MVGWRRRKSAATEASELPRWPEDWEGLAPVARVRVVADVVAGGTTARRAELHPLTEEALREIEADQPAPLAAAYRCFLALMGGGAGRLFLGSDVYYPELLGLRQAADELLAENNSGFELGHTDRVIAMHHGYQFWFLRGPGADPEVWGYSEGFHGDVPFREKEHFTDWLRVALARPASPSAP